MGPESQLLLIGVAIAQAFKNRIGSEFSRLQRHRSWAGQITIRQP